MSVFRTTNQEPAALPEQQSPVGPPRNKVPDGPTQRIGPAGRIGPPAKRSSVLLALVLAGVALNLAMVAGLIGWKALTAVRTMAQAPSAPVARPATTKTTSFAVSYAQEPLRVQVGCSAILYVDLDEPRTDAGSQVSDLRYDSRCGQEQPRLTLGPGATGGAQVRDSDTDAAGCARAIRTSPIGPGASVEVRKGVVLCVLTAAKPAEMVLVEITEVGQTGTAGMRATSWRVQG
jgi:hypothetical protein